MNYLNCADEVISGLMDLLSYALASYHPKLGPEATDMESLYAVLHILRPQNIELETFDGLIKMKRGLYEEAIASLRQVLEKRDFTYAKAMLAYCLFMKGDALWHGLADEVLAKDQSEETVQLIQAIKHYDELKKGNLSEEDLVSVLSSKNGYQSAPGA